MRFPVSSPKLYLLTRDRLLSCKFARLRVINVLAVFLLVISALTVEARGNQCEHYPDRQGSKTGF